MRILSIFSLAACSPTQVSSEPEEVVDTVDSSTSPDTDTDTDTDTEETEPDVEDIAGTPEEDEWPQDCAELYDPDLLPTFALDFTASEWSGIQSDCSSGEQNYRPVQFTYEGETVDAMVRLKGNWSWSCDKLQFIISFNEEDSGVRFHGLRKIMLDAPWYDHTLLHERIAFPLFEARGLPYSCVNSARLEINDEYYGLYANIERLDHEYLERNYANPDGNLYQGGSELKTNEDVNDTSDIEALNDANTVEEIAKLMDLDQAVAEWSMEAMIPAMDNYWAGVEINYYLYNHPDRGFVYLPYDLDISFGDAAYTSGELVWPSSATADPITYEHTGWRKEELVEIVLSDPYWCGRFVEELEISRAAYVPADLAALTTVFEAQIREALEEDAQKTFSDAQHDIALSRLTAFFSERADYVDTWLAQGEHCPANW
ncbi:MAG: hypothetical protein ACI8RZ_002356 [Myxococcota bacterium]|jgi:hypothetical protein